MAIEEWGYPGITAIREETGKVKYPGKKLPPKPKERRKTFIYTLYEGDKVITKGDSHDIADYLGVSYSYVNYAYQKGFLLRRRYSLKRVAV